MKRITRILSLLCLTAVVLSSVSCSKEKAFSTARSLKGTWELEKIEKMALSSDSIIGTFSGTQLGTITFTFGTPNTDSGEKEVYEQTLNMNIVAGGQLYSVFGADPGSADYEDDMSKINAQIAIFNSTTFRCRTWGGQNLYVDIPGSAGEIPLFNADVDGSTLSFSVNEYEQHLRMTFVKSK